MERRSVARRGDLNSRRSLHTPEAGKSGPQLRLFQLLRGAAPFAPELTARWEIYALARANEASPSYHLARLINVAKAGICPTARLRRFDRRVGCAVKRFRLLEATLVVDAAKPCWKALGNRLPASTRPLP